MNSRKPGKLILCVYDIVIAVIFLVPLTPLHASVIYPWVQHSKEYCTSKVTPALTLKEIENRLNTQFRKSVAHNLKSRRLTLASIGINIFSPFRAREQANLLIDGKLPPVGTFTDIVLVRKSRNEGLKELSKAVSFSEERSWTFIPELNIWFYDTIGFARANSCGRNLYLRKTLVEEWSHVEEYHTHPWAAFHDDMRSDSAKQLFERLNVSEKAYALLFLGRPSKEDYINIIARDAGEPHFRKPKFDSYIVHPWGLTYYSIEIGMQKQDDGSEMSVYPPSLGWEDEDFDFTRGQHSLGTALRKMIEKQVERSNKAHSNIYRQMHLPEAEWPKLIVEYYEFPFDHKGANPP